MILNVWFTLAVGTPDWLPTWLYLGPITLDSVSIVQSAFAVALLAGVFARRRRQPRMRAGEFVIAALAALTILAALYATIRLNTAPGGVFFAVFLPLGAGVLLALVDVVYRVGQLSNSVILRRSSE